MTRSKKDAALEEAWRAAAKAVGGQFSKPLYPFGAAVQVRSGIHRLTLSATQVQNSGDTAGATWITRVRTLLLSDDSFSFSVYPAGPFSGIGAMLGLQDIEIGEDRFDRVFVVKGSAPRRVRKLFRDEAVRRPMFDARYATVTLGPARRAPFVSMPEGMRELSAHLRGRILEPGRLQALFAWVGTVLPRVAPPDEGFETDFGRLSRRLADPTGIVRENVVVWDGVSRRREAARLLGELGDARAMDPLLDLLENEDDDDAVREAALAAVVRMADHRLVPFFIARLGNRTGLGDQSWHERAVGALEALGAEHWVGGYQLALEGDPEELKGAVGAERRAAILALENGLASLKSVQAAARALSALAATESIPALERARRQLGITSAKEACARAIAELESRASLPRPADAPAPDLGALPRPASQPDPDLGALLRPASQPDPDEGSLPRPAPKPDPADEIG